MNEELFTFHETEGGYILSEFNGDETVTEVTTPPEYNGKPVVKIGNGAFSNAIKLQKITISENVRSIGTEAFFCCEALRSISLPASLESIGSFALLECEALCEVEFKSYPKFGAYVFGFGCLPSAEITLMGVVRSRDITNPIDLVLLRDDLKIASGRADYKPWFSRADVVALAMENDCFREIDVELVDALIDYSAKNNTTEITAYFLELKRQKSEF